MLDATPAVPPSPEVEAAHAAEAARAEEASEPTPLRKRLRWPFLTALLVELLLVLGDRIPSVDAMSYFETGRNFVNGRGYTLYQSAFQQHLLCFDIRGGEMGAVREFGDSYGEVATAVTFECRIEQLVNLLAAIANEPSLIATNGIRVNAVAPGIIRTPMHSPESIEFLAGLHPVGRVGEIQEVVDAVLYLESAGFVTGETLRVDGGAHAGRW